MLSVCSVFFAVRIKLIEGKIDMKNIIYYYYNLYANKFKKINDCFAFEINKKQYEFIPFYGDVNSVFKNYQFIISSKKYCHQIILNKDNSILTYYKNKPYLLIRKDFCIDKYVDIDEIINYDILVNGDYNLNWKNLWKEKIDYYEYQISELAFKYPVLKKSFNYYVGLTENAISLLNYIDKSNINYYICHKRVNYKQKLCDFFNPTEIVIDNITRDIAEYIKNNYLNDNITINEVCSIIDKLNFNYTESILFLSRITYPSYYFDLYDEIIQEIANENKIEYYIKKNTMYEIFLKQVYEYLKGKYALPEIEWMKLK